MIFSESYKKRLMELSGLITEDLNKISLQQAKDRSFFGPVYHGSSKENLEKIDREGFKVFIGVERSENISHGYQDIDYFGGTPPPIHHLGFGVYFTTVKSIALQYNQRTQKGLRTYFLDVPKLETINFGSQKNMMKWWIQNGYDTNLALKGDQGRVEATKKLTDNLKSKYDAVWFKGKGINRLLDGDQIVVFDPSRIYQIDLSLSSPMEMGSKVIRTEDKIGIVRSLYDTEGNVEHTKGIIIPKGTSGMILQKRPTKEMLQFWKSNNNTEPHWAEGSEYVYTIKWAKGGTEQNVLDKHIAPKK